MCSKNYERPAYNFYTCIISIYISHESVNILLKGSFLSMVSKKTGRPFDRP